MTLTLFAQAEILKQLCVRVCVRVCESGGVKLFDNDL